MTQLTKPFSIDVTSTQPPYKEGGAYIDPDTGALWVGFNGSYSPVPPIRIRQEAATFRESGITVTHNNTVPSAGSIGLQSVIADYEDGSLNPKNPAWELSGTFGNPSTTTTTALSGTNSLELAVNGDGEQVQYGRSSEIQLGKLPLLFRVSTQTANASDLSLQVGLRDASGNNIGYIKFYGDGTSEFFNGASNAMGSWSASTTYTLDTNFDWTNEEVTISFGGSTYGPFAFQSSVSGLGAVTAYADDASGTGWSTFVDDISTGYDTGDAIIEFPTPTDLRSWDIVGFQQTLDNESVTVDVEDGAGNVIQSDIPSDYDISSVADSTQVRLHVYLSRTNSNNFPSLDYAARRYFR